MKYHLKGVKHHSIQTVDLKNESQKVEKLIAKLTDDLKQYIEVNKSSVDKLVNFQFLIHKKRGCSKITFW